MTTPTAGPEQQGPERPATFGGPTFPPRTASHGEEVAAGRLWRACGARSEVAPLRLALLSWPGDALAQVEDPDAWLMLERPDLGALRAQTLAVEAALTGLGVSVVVHRDHQAPPNYLFMRDLAFLTPEGAVLARPAATVRAGEERWMAEILARLGVPILRTLTGTAVFEGADALWARPDTVLVGLGRRTNDDGFRAVSRVLAEQGVAAQAVALPEGTQHLLGVVMFLDHDLAAVHGGRLTAGIRAALTSLGYRLLVLPPDDEVVARRALNLVTVAPRRVLMPAGCPATRRALEAEGVEVHAVDVSEYVKAGGALGCLTSVLQREG